MRSFRANHQGRHRGLPKPLVLLLVLLLTASGLTLAEPTANAAAPYRVGYLVNVDGYGLTIGTFAPMTGSGGHRVICIDTAADHPSSLKSPSSVKDADINYLMWKYIDQTSSDLTGAALAEIVKTSYDSNQTWRKKAWNALSSTRKSSITAKMTTLKAEGTKYAGPYTLTPTITKTSNGRGTVSFGIKTSSGAYFPNVAVTLTLTNAVFTSNSSTSLKVTSTTALQSATIKATNDSRVTVKATSATDLPSVYFKKYPASSSSDQDMAGANFTETSVTGTAYIDGFATSPILSSTVGTSYADTGSTLSDTVTVTGGVPGEQLTVNTTVYGPLASQPSATTPAAPAGVKSFETLSRTVTLDSSGAATVKFTTAHTTSTAGYYVWQESTVATSTMEAALSSYGRASETTAVGKPTLATNVSAQKSRVGDTISDTAVVSGLNLVSSAVTPLTATLTGSLLGPIDQVDGSCSGLDWSTAPTAATIPATKVTANGSISGLGKFTVTDTGCYTYTETLVGTAGGSTVWTVVHEAGKTAQTSYVTANLVLSSQVTKQVAGSGERLSDAVDVRGVPDGVSVTLRSTLYGPLGAMPSSETQTVPDGTPVVEQFSSEVVGTGLDQTFTFTTTDPVNSAGFYVWVESVDALSDGGVDATQSTFGQVVETTRVVTPKVSTAASTSKAALNDQLSDTATLSGVEDTLAMAASASVSAQVTLSGKLLGPVAASVDDCTKVDWSTADTAVTIAEQQVTTDGDVPDLGGFKADKPGCYTYTETLTATVDGQQAWQVVHQPGIASQTFLVATPAMVTQTSDDLVGVNAQIADTITVTNMGSNQGQITARLYGPYSLSDSEKCSSISNSEWQSAVDAGSLSVSADQTIDVTADGTYTTAAVATPEAGCYTWWEQLKVGDVDQPSFTATTPLGLVTETSTVVSPTITTTAVSSSGDTAGKLFDSVLIAGSHGMTGTISGFVLGPLPKNTEMTCDGLDWSAASKVADITPIKISGDGVYKTKSIQPNAKGCYTFVETITMDDVTAPAVTTDPGISNETLYLRPASSGGGSGGGIDSGQPAGPSLVAPMMFGGAMVMAGLFVVAAAMRRRHQS